MATITEQKLTKVLVKNASGVTQLLPETLATQVLYGTSNANSIDSAFVGVSEVVENVLTLTRANGASATVDFGDMYGSAVEEAVSSANEYADETFVKLEADSQVISGALNVTSTLSTGGKEVATKEYAESLITSMMDFRGNVPSGGLPTGDDVKTGWTYRVATAGEYNGEQCEVGDLIVKTGDGWTVVQNNIDITGLLKDVTYTSAAHKYINNISSSNNAVIAEAGFAMDTLSVTGEAGVRKAVTAISYDEAGTLSATIAEVAPAVTATVVEEAVTLGTDDAFDVVTSISVDGTTSLINGFTTKKIVIPASVLANGTTSGLVVGKEAVDSTFTKELRVESGIVKDTLDAVHVASGADLSTYRIGCIIFEDEE